MKIAVVGGGSTYTPELVDGLGRLRDVLPVDELVLVDPAEPTGSSWSPASGGGSWRGSAHPARLVTSTTLEPALDGVDAVLLQLRVGGQAARNQDETWPLECGCVGQETTGAGGLAKALRTVPVVLDIAEQVTQGGARRVDHRLHQPGRHRHPRAAPGGAPRGRAVQRGDRVPAALRGLARRTPGVAGARPRRAQPPDLGAGRAGGRRGPAAGAAGVARRGDRLVGRAAARAAALAGRRAVLLPALLLRPRRGGPRAARGAVAGRGGGRDRARSCWSCTPTRRSTRSRSCSASAAGRSTPRPRCSWPRGCSVTVRPRRTW